jgi:hypothetical protein
MTRDEILIRVITADAVTLSRIADVLENREPTTPTA